MAENVSFEILLSAKWWKDPPKVNIFLDDTLIESEIYIDQLRSEGKHQTFKFDKELEEGEHQLIIEYLNKTNADTIIDEDGNILNDQLLFINNISIDDIELGNGVIFKCCAFYPSEARLQEVSWLEKEIFRINTLGHSGKWIIKFATPTYLWLLENL